MCYARMYGAIKKRKMKLGNLIELITRYTGIKWIIKSIFGDACRCDERRDTLNDIELW